MISYALWFGGWETGSFLFGVAFTYVFIYVIIYYVRRKAHEFERIN